MTAVVFASPDDAESAFYEAFANKDLRQMMEVWADHDEVACVHPMGPRLTTRRTVLESWHQIFASERLLNIRTEAARNVHQDAVAVHTLNEVITTGEGDKETVVVVTNVYERGVSGWCMVLHHASLSPATVKQDIDEQPTSTLVH